MSYRIISLISFNNQLKHLVKRHPSFKTDYESLLDSLEINPFQGAKLSNNCYKIRLAIKSKGKGKSAGARVITHLAIVNETIYMVAIYDKSEKQTFTEAEILTRLKEISGL